MGLATQNYDILTRLAVGNGALVYRAVEKAGHRQVALKLLVQDGDVDHRFDVDALLTAAPQLKMITGAHVCQLLDAFTDEDGPVLVYEFANGINGSDLPHQRKLDAAQALDVAAQLMSALRSGERQKCPHGDIKPSNLIFLENPDNRPFTVVLDWALTAFRTAVADDTLTYLAPERLDGAPASHQADLFSAGATLFYLFTANMLVGGKVREEIQVAWQQVRPAVLSELRPDLHPKLVQWICNLLEIDPSKRPESAVEALAALTSLGTPPPAIPPESFRARPATQKTQAPAQTPTASAIRQKPPASAAAFNQTPKTPAQPPAKKSHVFMTLGLFLIFAGLVAGVVWFSFFRNRDKKYPGETAAEEPSATSPTIAARTPAPSVGENVGKTYTPPPLPPKNTASATPPVKPTLEATPAQPPRRRKNKPPNPTPSPTPSKPASNAPSPYIARDTFAGMPADLLDGKESGAGWAAPWSGPLARIEPAATPQLGATLFIPPTDREVLLSRPIGPLENFVEPAEGGSWFFAFHLQHSTDLPTPGGDIQLNPINSSDIHDLVRIVATDVGGSLQVTLNNEKKPVEVRDTSKPALVVLRIALQNPKLGNWDLNAELCVNPVIGSQWPPVGSQMVTVKLNYIRLPQQFGLLIRKPRAEAATRIADIRFCRNLADLTPAPSSGKR